jgi:ribonuclease HI
MPEQMGSSVLDPKAIHIYTDGSCYKNPGGDSGCAAIVHYFLQADFWPGIVSECAATQAEGALAINAAPHQ